MKKILTGIKPSGVIHLGNYLGMIKEVIEFQGKYEIFLMIADLHAQTVPYSPKELRKLTLDIAKSLVALGVDPKKTVLFKQSDVPAHLYLYWILGCLVSEGDLRRMHEYKEQKEKYKENVGTGILMYPVLMAADILIYNADLVPVGKDQEQHLELTRELVRKFNNKFGKLFKIPQVYIPSETSKIMSLTNPLKKMSKSEPEGCLEIFENEKRIKEKILKAVTDSEAVVKYDPEKKPGISNLMTIYKYLTKKSYHEIEEEFKNKGYYEFKLAVYKAFMNFFKEKRERKKRLSDSYIQKLLILGAKKANKVANENLEKILKATGLR